MKSLNSWKFRSLLLMMTLIFTWNAAYAVQVSFSGTLRSNPPCHITGDNDPIEVNFGEVGITRIDGINYAKSFSLTVTCDADLGNDVALYFGYDGMSASFDDRALQTSTSGLGILLYRSNGNVLVPDNANNAIKMSGSVPVTLSFTAVPVKDSDPSLVLYEGPFTALGTVEIRYP